MRIWRVSKEAGRPFPVLSDDDVIDYQIIEALAAKARKEEKEARDKQEREAFKKDREGLKQFA